MVWQFEQRFYTLRAKPYFHIAVWLFVSLVLQLVRCRCRRVIATTVD
jgi:hypothetical protein